MPPAEVCVIDELPEPPPMLEQEQREPEELTAPQAKLIHLVGGWRQRLKVLKTPNGCTSVLGAHVMVDLMVGLPTLLLSASFADWESVRGHDAAIFSLAAAWAINLRAPFVFMLYASCTRLVAEETWKLSHHAKFAMCMGQFMYIYAVSSGAATCVILGIWRQSLIPPSAAWGVAFLLAPCCNLALTPVVFVSVLQWLANRPSWYHRRCRFDEVPEGERLDADPKCCICLDEIKEDHNIMQLHCRHVFHQDCIDVWIRMTEKKDCPMRCRPDDEAAPEASSPTGRDSAV